MDMSEYQKAYIVEFPEIGNPHEGYISISEMESSLPIQVKRAFWTYYTPESIVRGRHAHYKTEQILIAVAGRIIVNIEYPDANVETFVLERPNKGLYIPPNVWHTMQYSHNSVQLVYASSVYDEKDYIRSYELFKEVWANK
jgi:mannose-6-phosphate isomerase-like protein (cupin superfamily)